MERVLDVLRAGIDHGLHLGAQIYVSQHGRVLLDEAIGEAAPGTPMTRETLTLWMSAGKPITAIAAAHAVREELIHLDDAVSEYIEGFEQHGKQAVTVRHLLTHTVGLRNVGRNWDPRPWAEVIAELRDAPLEPGWTPGEKAGYHVASTWYLLAEVVRIAAGAAATDAALSALLRERVLQPMGMADSYVGMPAEVYQSNIGRIAPAYDTSKGDAKPQAFTSSEAGCTLCRPGGNARGPARELGGFYAQLLHGRQADETLRRFTSPQRVGMIDQTFKTPIDWGLGFLMNTNDGRHAYGYGPAASDQTFGHSGNQSSCAFADPRHGLAVAWVTNGMPGEVKHQSRQRAVHAAIYEAINEP